MLTEAEALRVLTEYAPELDADASAALLARHTITRTVQGQLVTLHDPYAAALANLMRPDRVTQQTQGSVSETYINPQFTATYLREQSRALQLTWPLADAGAALPLNTDMDLRGWGN